MKPKAKRLSKAKQLHVDRISTLPSSIIENILCLVSIKEAARTSILSKDWKYKWTTIPKLVFDEEAFEVKLTHEGEDEDEDEDEDEYEDEDEDELNDRKKMTTTCRTFYAIYQVLLMHQGPIHEFTLSMEANNRCVEIDQILYHLSRNNNNVKKFTLDLREYDGYRVPLSVFSLHKLTHLDLRNCIFPNLTFRSTINGFVNLTSLCLDHVSIPVNTIQHLISKAPLLKSFTLIMHNYSGVYPLDSTIYDLLKPIYDLLEHLQMIEHMTISVSAIQMCNEFEDMDSVTFIEYPDIWLEHLTEFEVKDYCNLNLELEFVKLILVKSPKLKKVSIWLDESVDVNEEVKMLRLLLRTPRASPMVDIIVEHLP